MGALAWLHALVHALCTPPIDRGPAPTPTGAAPGSPAVPTPTALATATLPPGKGREVAEVPAAEGTSGGTVQVTSNLGPSVPQAAHATGSQERAQVAADSKVSLSQSDSEGEAKSLRDARALGDPTSAARPKCKG